MAEVLRVLVAVADLEELGHRVDLIDPVTRKFIKRLLVPKQQEATLELQIQTKEEEREARRPAVGKNIRRSSQQQERRIADDIDGRQQPASGALPFARGDVRKKGRLRVEAKCTHAKSFRLTEAILDGIIAQSSLNEIPTVVVDFVDSKTNKVRRSIAVVPYEDWVRETNAADLNT